MAWQAVHADGGVCALALARGWLGLLRCHGKRYWARIDEQDDGQAKLSVSPELALLLRGQERTIRQVRARAA